ncbi:hypothetical protein Droror1_Dr00015351 [Drosera rotundifolia]
MHEGTPKRIFAVFRVLDFSQGCNRPSSSLLPSHAATPDSTATVDSDGDDGLRSGGKLGGGAGLGCGDGQQRRVEQGRGGVGWLRRCPAGVFGWQFWSPVRRRISYWIWALLGVFCFVGFVLFVVHHNHDRDRVAKPMMVYVLCLDCCALHQFELLCYFHCIWV